MCIFMKWYSKPIEHTKPVLLSSHSPLFYGLYLKHDRLLFPEIMRFYLPAWPINENQPSNRNRNQLTSHNWLVILYLYLILAKQ